MTITMLTITVTAIALLAVYSLATKGQPAEAVAGETTLSDAVAGTETLVTARAEVPATRTDWQLTTVSALSDAEELLDALEFQGYAERELVVLGNSCFAVRWR